MTGAHPSPRTPPSSTAGSGHDVVDTWLGDGAMLAHLHLPTTMISAAAVVICPPLGQDLIVAYRTLRYLAHTLADQGVAAVRFDYPGFGDSTHNLTDDALEQGASMAAAALRSTGYADILYVGLGSGCLAASVAAANDEAAAGIVLWDPVPSGRQWLRRQKTLLSLALGDRLEEAPPGIEVIAGAELNRTFAARISCMSYDPDLAKRMPMLLAHRDDAETPVPTSLTPGTDRIDLLPIGGHAEALDVSSVLASIPAESVQRVSGWILAHQRSEPDPTNARRYTPENSAIVTIDGVEVTESITRVGPDRLFGIETSPSGGAAGAPAVILHSGSSEHRIGATRHQVELARRLAARGIRALRVDRRGTGESSPSAANEPSLLFTQDWIDDATHAVEHVDLPREKLGVIGLCAGGWASLYGAPQRTKFLGILGMNNYRAAPVAANHARALELAGETKAEADPHRKRMALGPALGRAVAIAKQRAPYALMVQAASRGLVQFAEPALRPALAAGADVILYFAPEDENIFRNHRGYTARQHLKSQPGKLTTIDDPQGDHSLFSPGIRRRALDWAVEEASRQFGMSGSPS